MKITESDVLKVQEEWAACVINIGKKFIKGDEYREYAEQFLDNLYAFSNGNVLFKPTLASKTQFRLNKNAALSYFIGNNHEFKEDNGFALTSWDSIKFENIQILIFDKIALAMGNYFMVKDGISKKIEYSFAYKKDDHSNLRIVLHDSHLPFKPGTF
mgnify:FL=1